MDAPNIRPRLVSFRVLSFSAENRLPNVSGNEIGFEMNPVIDLGLALPATPDGQSVVIDITGGVPRHIVCTIVDGRAAIVKDEPEAPLSRITMDTATFLALATGRQTDQQLADKISYSGDLDHGRKVTSALNMMI